MKTTRCKHCGHPCREDRITGLALTPTQDKIFRIVSSCSPAGITAVDLTERVWADDLNGGPDSTGTIHRHVFYLNQRLKRKNLRINGRRGPGFGGYALVRV